MSSFVWTLTVDRTVGPLWYWTLRCWDDEVHQQDSLLGGAVKVGIDPQLACAIAMQECAARLEEICEERWVLPFPGE